MTVEEQVDAQVAEIFTVVPKVPCSEWAPENVFLDRLMTSRPGPYDLSRTPYAREVLDFPLQSYYDKLVVRKSSRVGMTEAALCLIRWAPKHHPGNIIFAIDTQSEMRELNDTRLKSSLLELYGGAEIEDEEKVKALIIKLSNMMIYMGGGASKGLYENKWARIVILDEISNHALNADPESKETSPKLGYQRIKDTPGGVLIEMGKPGEEGEIMDQEYSAGTQEVMEVPCQGCGNLEEITFERLKFGECKDLIGKWDLQRVENETVLTCSSCDYLATWERDLRAMVTAPEARWRSTLPEGRRPTELHTRSIHISDLYSQDAKCAWGIIAREFLEAMESGAGDLFAFITGRLGKSPEAKSQEITDDVLTAMRSGFLDEVAGAVLGPRYRLGFVAEERFCPVPLAELEYITWCWDVQDKSYKGVCVAVCADGRMFLIDYAEVLAEEDVWERYFMSYPCGSADSEEMGMVSLGFIDSGDGVTSERVEGFCVALQDAGRSVYPSKGGSATSGKTWVERASRQFGDRKRYDYWDKSLTSDLLHCMARTEGRRLFMPEDILEHPELASELSNVKIKVKKGRNGRKIREIDDLKQHDYFDAFKECYLTSKVRLPVS